MHGRRKSQLHNAAYPQQAKSDPLVEVPDDLLETSFKRSAKPGKGKTT